MSKTINYNGVGFCGLLTIAFIVLKLCGVIDWHWGWVLAPLWMPLAIAFAVGTVILLVMAFIFVVALFFGKKKKSR